MSMNKYKIKNLLNYTTTSFKSRDDLKSDRYNKANESDMFQVVKTKKNLFDETSKDRISTIDLRQSNNVTKSIDFNSRLKKNLDKSGTDIFAKMNLSKKNSKENLSNLLYDEKSTTAGSKSIRESFSLSSSLKRKINDNNNYNQHFYNLKTKLLKEIAHYRNTLINDLPTTSNRPIAFSNNKDVKINASEYFEFSPTKVREKSLVNANYFKILRDKQHSNENNTEKAYFKNNHNILNKNEKEDSFDLFMKDFKDDKITKTNQFVVKYKNHK